MHLRNENNVPGKKQENYHVLQTEGPLLLMHECHKSDFSLAL
jgi:hypothetical protein